MTTTHNPRSAEPAPAPTGSGAPKGGAEGVLSAVRPDPRPAAGHEPEWVFFGLHIIAPPSFSAATSATAACRCGYRRQGKGRAAVLRIVEDFTNHQTACPHHTGLAERRNVA
ncbi:hypothetical protein [Streptomyces sp. NPDC101393]|uniref:hypothetical protein n=1 Tax=Streptomyces sp. NPDC101393 TaxID=3366141 RepID=UPI0037F49013